MMRKRVLLVPDGMADEPQAALGGRTPLEAAHTPCMDGLARGGVVGLVRTVPEGMAAGSDVANLAVLGYDPAAVFSGRSPLEAASIGVELGARRRLVPLQPRHRRGRRDEGQHGRAHRQRRGPHAASRPCRPPWAAAPSSSTPA